MITINEAREIRAKMQEIIRLASGDTAATNDDLIQAETLADEWSEGSYSLNDVRRKGGQVWRCCQGHDSTGNPDWYPGAVPALWTLLHGSTPETAKPFVQPTGAQDAYLKGECAVWTDGKIYRSVMDTANSYSPADYPQGWELIE